MLPKAFQKSNQKYVNGTCRWGILIGQKNSNWGYFKLKDVCQSLNDAFFLFNS